MKTKKIVALALFAALMLSATACGKEPIATSPEEVASSDVIAINESDGPITDASDLEENVDIVTEPSNDEVFPYTLGDFGDADVSIEAVGSEVLVANVDSDFGAYSCSFANYDHGDTIRVEITADESIDNLTYSAVFSENYAAPSSGTVVSGAAERNDDGVFVIEFTDEQEADGVYYLNIVHGEDQAFVNISVGYTADTIVDYFDTSAVPVPTDDVSPVVPSESDVEASETTIEE